MAQQEEIAMDLSFGMLYKPLNKLARRRQQEK